MFWRNSGKGVQLSKLKVSMDKTMMLAEGLERRRLTRIYDQVMDQVGLALCDYIELDISPKFQTSSLVSLSVNLNHSKSQSTK